MAPIAQIEYFRVPPRWLFVKITDADGNYGWGEASLEGHTEAVEGCLAAFAERFTGADAEYVYRWNFVTLRLMLTLVFLFQSDIEHVWQNGYRMGFYRGGPILMSALSGVDIALWDLKGGRPIEAREELVDLMNNHFSETTRPSHISASWRKTEE